LNGIKLKSNDLSPLKVERIKWMILLILSHLFVFLLLSIQEEPILKPISKVRSGYVRLQLPLISQASLSEDKTLVILMTEDQKIITREAELIKLISLREGIDSSGTQYLVDIPERDMEKLIRIKNKTVFAYPATKHFRPNKKLKTKEIYEIHF
jgi:hypothetical protein